METIQKKSEWDRQRKCKIWDYGKKNQQVKIESKNIESIQVWIMNQIWNQSKNIESIQVCIMDHVWNKNKNTETIQVWIIDQIWNQYKNIETIQVWITYHNCIQSKTIESKQVKWWVLYVIKVRILRACEHYYAVWKALLEERAKPLCYCQWNFQYGRGRNSWRQHYKEVVQRFKLGDTNNEDKPRQKLLKPRLNCLQGN